MVTIVKFLATYLGIDEIAVRIFLVLFLVPANWVIVNWCISWHALFILKVLSVYYHMEVPTSEINFWCTGIELNIFFFCSCIGQNLQTSSNSWENFFVILVTICGLLLLLFLFGNMQVGIGYLFLIFTLIFICLNWRRIQICNSYELCFLLIRCIWNPKLWNQRRWVWGCKRLMSGCPLKSSPSLFNNSLRYTSDTYGENPIILM